MKLVYLWYYLGAGVYLTYVALYLRSIHLSGVEIGLLTSMVPLAGVVFQPVWGLLSDRYRWRKQLLALSLLSSALIAPGIALAHSFASLFVLVVALAVALSPTIPLSDATTLEWLAEHGGSYGAVRIYGSIGFLVGSISAGRLLAVEGIHVLFPLYAFFLAGTFLVSLTAPVQSRQYACSPGGHHGSFRAVLSDRIVVGFLALAGLGYATFAAYNTFFALYLHGIGASTTMIGLAVGAASVSELPVMALSGRVIARFGVKPLLLAGLGAAATRWLFYGLLHDYRLVLVFQLLHGLSFAGFYVAGVTYIDREVPAHLRSTGQTLFYGATFGVGTVAGANVFGALFDHVHAQGIFLIAAGICAVTLAGMVVYLPSRRVMAERVRAEA